MSIVPLTPEHDLACINPNALTLRLSPGRPTVGARPDDAGWAALRWQRPDGPSLPVACSLDGQAYSNTDWHILLTLAEPKPSVSAIRQFLKMGGDPCTRYPNAHGPLAGAPMVFALVVHGDLPASAVARLLTEVGKKTPLPSIRHGRMTLIDAALRRGYLDGLLLAQWLKTKGVSLGGHPSQATSTLHNLLNAYLKGSTNPDWVPEGTTRPFHWPIQAKEAVFAPLQADMGFGRLWFQQWLVDLNFTDALSQPLRLVNSKGQVAFDGPMGSWLVAHLRNGTSGHLNHSALGAMILNQGEPLRQLFEQAPGLPWDAPTQLADGATTSLRTLVAEWPAEPTSPQNERLPAWHRWKFMLTERLLRLELPDPGAQLAPRRRL